MIAAAGALLAGCAGTSDVTRISGKVTVDAVDEVNVVVPEMEIDTLVPVKDGKFYVEVPANPRTFGSIAAASYGVQFIPDGTEIDQETGVCPVQVLRLPGENWCHHERLQHCGPFDSRGYGPYRGRA